MITFGAGKLIATPTTDATGAAVANPTPVAVAVLQDVSVDFDFVVAPSLTPDCYTRRTARPCSMPQL